VKRIENSISIIEDQENSDAVARNSEILMNSRDWLIWICECLLYFDISLRSGGISDAVACFSDTSTNSYERYAASTASAAVEEESSICDDTPRASSIDILISQFSDPLFNLVQSLLFIDIKMKPTPARKYHDVLRLPFPEIQVTILFDLLEAFEHSSMSDQVLNNNQFYFPYSYRVFRAGNIF
jgi:hypothetical protein